jgi:integrase
MAHLTPAAARDLKPGGILRDADIPGFYLRAGQGTKTYTLYYRTREGVERRLKVGRYPEMNLSEARDLAKEFRRRIAAGEDPSGEWQAAREIPTVADLCDKFLADWAAKRLADNSYEQARQLIDVQIKPGLGKMRVTDVRSTHVDKFLENVFNRKYVGGGGTAHWTAHHTKKLVAKLFKRVKKFYGIRLLDDPMEDTAVYGRIKRKRYATPDELPRLKRVIDELSLTQPRRAALFWTLFLTGGRVSEIRELTGAQIDDTSIVLEQHKTVRHIGAKTVVLPAAAIQILSKLDPVKPHERIFGDISKDRLEKVWASVRDKAQCPGLKMLDARRTFASIGLTLGMSLEQVGDLLGHTDAETTKGYAYLIAEAKQKLGNRIADAIVQASNQLPATHLSAGESSHRTD